MNKHQHIRYSRSSRGFTVVELLVVIIIISILVAISYFGFNMWRSNITKTALTSDLKGVHTGMESAKNWNNGYPLFAAGSTFDGNATTKSVFKQSKDNTLTYRSGTSTTYCIDATNAKEPSVRMFLNIAGGNKEPKKGTCAGGEEV